MDIPAPKVATIVKSTLGLGRDGNLNPSQDYWTNYAIETATFLRSGGILKSSGSITNVRFSFLQSLPETDYPITLEDFLRRTYHESMAGAANQVAFGDLPETRRNQLLSLIGNPANNQPWLNSFYDWQALRNSTFGQFSTFSNEQKSLLMRVLASIEAVANIKFYLDGSAEAVAAGVNTGTVIRFGNTVQPINGSYQLTDGFPESGALNYRAVSVTRAVTNDVMVNSADANNKTTSVTAIQDFETASFQMLHEVLHALGLDHPFERSPLLVGTENATAYTTMARVGLYDRVTPGIFDVGALQQLYGARNTTSGGSIRQKAT